MYLQFNKNISIVHAVQVMYKNWENFAPSLQKFKIIFLAFLADIVLNLSELSFTCGLLECQSWSLDFSIFILTYNYKF